MSRIFEAVGMGPEAASEAAAALLRAQQLSAERTLRLTRTHLDTFDWRVHRDGGSLTAEVAADSSWLVWRDRETGELRARVRLTGPPPRMASDLGVGPLRRRLGPLIDVRCLMPMATLDVSRAEWSRRDARDKVTLRAAVERAGDRTTLRVEPVRGHHEVAEALVAALAPAGWAEIGDLELARALEGAGRAPGDYTGKVRVALDPAAPAGVAARQILAEQLDTIVANVEGARDGEDIEFLHDLRVAVRRTRSALSQLSEALPADVVEAYKEPFRWVGAITSPVRDYDVYLDDFAGLVASLPPEDAAALEPLRAHVVAARVGAREAMLEGLDSARWRELIDGWRAFLDVGSESSAAPGPAAARPVGWYAGRRIWKTYKKVIAEGAAIDDATPAEALHELRKRCKKLRYLLEFFASLFPPKRIKGLVKALKRLQDVLGRHQDFEVQALALREFAGRIEAGPETLIAMGMLVHQLNGKQAAARAEFAARFAGFASDAVRREFRALREDAD